MALTPTDMSSDPLDDFARVVREELREIVEQVTAEAGDETMYFFALNLHYRHLSPSLVANSLEALARGDGIIYAEQNITDFERDPWDPGQWRWIFHCRRIDECATAIEERHDAWLADHPDRDDPTWEAIIARVDEIYLTTFEAFDQEGLFGPARTNGETALLLMDHTDYVEADWRRIFRRLNPPAIEARLLQTWGLQ